MTRVAYVDATAGVAGDMMMAALVSAGADFEQARSAIRSIGIPGLDLLYESVRRGGLECSKVTVSVPDDRESRTAKDVLELVARSSLPPSALRFARSVFHHLARAEGLVHGMDSALVHFHEVGAHDSIADVVGVASLLHGVGLLDDGARIHCSALAAGSGSVLSAHGRIPVPVPAVLKLLEGSDLSLDLQPLQGERTTPTGAALLRAIATDQPLPSLKITSTGMGAGTRDTPDRPNITRIVIGDSESPGAEPRTIGRIDLVESTVDDLDPQIWPAVLAELRSVGAFDCWITPITARHGRPAQLVSVLCQESFRDAVVESLFHHTGTFGVRWSAWERETLHRRTIAVLIDADGTHTIDVKIGWRHGEPIVMKPEIQQVAEVAARTGRSIREICDLVTRATPGHQPMDTPTGS